MIPNPERGLYGWDGSNESESYLNLATLSGLQSLYSAGLRLSLGLMDLSSCRTGPIPDALMTLFSNQLALGRQAGIKWVVRPIYNYASGGQDASKSVMLGHIAQLAVLFNANDDVIAFNQLGLVGAFGEHHDSTNGLTTGSNTITQDFKDVYNAATAAYSSAKFVGLRYPVHAKAMGWPAKAAIYADCQLEGPTEGGTFSSQSDPLRAETGAQCATRPYGGETCNYTDPQSRHSSAQAITDFQLFHAAYLNQEYDKAYIANWKTDGGYNTIVRFLGFRFQLDQISHQTAASKASSVSFSISTRNLGYSRIFQTRPLVVTLKNRSTGALIKAAGSDLTTLPAQATSSTLLSVSVPIPADAAAGIYDVYLSAPDTHASIATNAKFAVQFANSDSGNQAWDAASAVFKTGTTVTVS